MAKLDTIEQELKMLKNQPINLEAGAPQDFEQRVTEEVERRIAQIGALPQVDNELRERLEQAEQEKDRAVAEALRVAQEEADGRLAEIVTTKEQEISELRSRDIDIEDRIAEAVRAREAELKEIHEQEVKAAADAAFRRFKQPSNEKIKEAGIKYGEKLFNERWAKFMEENKQGSFSQEALDMAVEEATKKKDEEIAERVQKASEGAKNEAEMRNKLLVGKLQKQVSDAKAKLELYEKQFGPLSGTQRPSPQQPRPPRPGAPQTPEQQPDQQPPMAKVPTESQPLGTQQTQGAQVLQKLQTGRGGGMTRPGRGGPTQQGMGRGGTQPQGQGRGQRLSGQHPPQQTQNQVQRPAVNRPTPMSSPTVGQGQQRRGSTTQHSQLPRLAGGGLKATAPPFQPGAKRPRDDEQGGQANLAVGQKRTRVAGNMDQSGNDGQA